MYGIVTAKKCWEISATQRPHTESKAGSAHLSKARATHHTCKLRELTAWLGVFRRKEID